MHETLSVEERESFLERARGGDPGWIDELETRAGQPVPASVRSAAERGDVGALDRWMKGL